MNRRSLLLSDRQSSLVRPEGFEPPTYGFEARRSIQLSYGRAACRKRQSYQTVGAGSPVRPLALEPARDLLAARLGSQDSLAEAGILLRCMPARLGAR